MFSGIIEDMGNIVSVGKRGKGIRLSISSPAVARRAKAGDSIAVNGACLTVTNIDRYIMAFDVLKETSSRTNIGMIKKGDKVNLESSLKAGDRISGHFVTGHVDGTGEITGLKRAGGDVRMDVRVEDEILPYLAPRCSIAIDGVSLTAAGIRDGVVSVYLIPFTREKTTLGRRKRGNKVNVEADILAKYAAPKDREGRNVKTPMTFEVLRENGFI